MEVEYISEELRDEYEEGPKVDEMSGESKNLVFMLLKQVRIGMDLSRIVLPTFILEPRSMLEKLSDFLTHNELLAMVSSMEDPHDRIVGIVRWYLSGFYVKPKGVKKPYNPILGEFFRCRFQHKNAADDNVDSTTWFVSEQVSHHPPVSAFYVSNRKRGFVINGSILFRTKFMGTSVGSILDGYFILNILPFGEEYHITFPSAYAKGFLFGTLTMELSGNVAIQCRKTGYSAEIDFKSKPMFGGEYNALSGKILCNKEKLYTLQGKWDSRIELIDAKTNAVKTLWNPVEAVQNIKELKQKKKNGEKGIPSFHFVEKQTPAFEMCQPNESSRLWQKVTEAIKNEDQHKATAEKAVLEQRQREEAAQREKNHVVHHPKYFHLQKVDDHSPPQWTYKYINTKPWDPKCETAELEIDGVVKSI